MIDSTLDRYPFLDAHWARQLVRAYGTDVPEVFGDAKSIQDLGEVFGATPTAAEVRWLMDKEFATTAEDVVWRRNKLGLRLTAAEILALQDWMDARRRARSA